MHLKRDLFVSALALLSVVSLSCLPGDPDPGPGPLFQTEITVEAGYTSGGQLPGEASMFTVRWAESEDAEWYDVRIAPVPISDGNWDDAVRIGSIPSSGTGQMTAHLQVQPDIFRNTCIACGLCVEVCPKDAIQLVEGKAVIDTDKCTACGECVAVCPVSAVMDSRYGQPYYFAIRAVGPGGAPSQVVSTPDRYMLRYMNDEDLCAELGEDCYILREEYGPGCPVDAIWYSDDDDGSGMRDDEGLIRIDQDLCIHCGQCYIQCHLYDKGSILRQVVQD